MKKILPVLTIITLSCVCAWAIDKPLMDPKFKEIDIKIKKETDECSKTAKGPRGTIKCGKKIRKKYRCAGKMRGTEEYCEANYINLDFNKLEQLLKWLREQQNKARYSYDAMYDEDRQLGEVTKEDLQTEMIWIESCLARMQRAKTDRDEKSLKYLPGWGKNNK